MRLAVDKLAARLNQVTHVNPYNAQNNNSGEKAQHIRMQAMHHEFGLP